MHTVGIIGGADGPTAIYMTGKAGFSWLNLFGLVLVVLLLIPNIIYAVKTKNQPNRCTNKVMNLLEQVGRYGCMFLMVFSVGTAGMGFPSVGAFLVYAFGNAVLLIAYWAIWMLYFHKQCYWKQIALAVLPTCLFLLNGITMRHSLLVLFGLVFGIGHIYVTSRNRVD